MGARVVVGLDDHPRWRVRHTQVEHLAGGDQRVQAVHDLLDGGGEVPPVHVQQVDVVGAQLLQAAVDGDVHALDRVADKVGLDGLLVAVGGAKAGRILSCDAATVPVNLCMSSVVWSLNLHHLISVATLLHPLAQPFFRLLGLVVVCPS